jgi:hypothetical protein
MMFCSTTESFWAVLKTHFLPSVILTFAASEIIGTLLDSAMPPMAKLGPLRLAPRMMSALSCEMSLVIALAAPSSVDWLSSMISLIFRPFTPPAALVCSASSSRACFSGPPRVAPAPVMSRTAPIVMSPVLEPGLPASPDCSAHPARASRPTTVTKTARRRMMAPVR